MTDWQLPSRRDSIDPTFQTLSTQERRDVLRRVGRALRTEDDVTQQTNAETSDTA